MQNLIECALLTKVHTVALSAYMSCENNQDVCSHQLHETIRRLLPYLTAMLVYPRQNLYLKIQQHTFNKDSDNNNNNSNMSRSTGLLSDLNWP